MEQAYRDVEYGIEQWFNYFQAVAAFPQMSMPGSNVREMIAFINESGFGAIGTPDMCTAQIERLHAQSNGGFGAYLMLAHNWANPAGDAAQLRADRAPRDAAVPGASPHDHRRRASGAGGASGPGGGARQGSRDGDAALRRRGCGGMTGA